MRGAMRRGMRGGEKRMVRATVLDVLWKSGVFRIWDFEKASTAWKWVFPMGKSCIPFRSCLACLLVFSAFVVLLLCRRFPHSRSLGQSSRPQCLYLSPECSIHLQET